MTPSDVGSTAAETRRMWSARLARVPLPSEKLTMVLLAVLVLGVAILTVTPWPVGAFQDDAMYTVLAKSLAEGKGYRFLNLPGEPNATHFPPGYPLLLAGLWKLWPSFPDNIVLFKFVNAGLLAAAALGAFRYARQRFAAPVTVAAAVAIIGTLSIVVLLVTGVVMSEPMFLALLFPTLLRAERAAETGRARDAAVAGALLGALALVRTIGVFAVPAAGLVMLWRRRWAGALTLGAVALAVLTPWQLWVGAHQHEVAPVLVGKFGSYGGWLVEGYRLGGAEFALAVLRRNATELEAMLSYYFLPVVARWPRAVVMAIVLSFALLGMKRFLRVAPVSLLFLVFYTLVIMAWPFEPARFVLAVWPLWPLLVGSGVLAVWHSAARLPAGPVSTGAIVALALAVAAFVGGSGWYNAMGYSRKWWVSVQRDAGKRARPIVEWAARYTDSTDVLSTEDDLIVYLYAHRKAVPTSTFRPAQRLAPLTDAQDATVAREIFAAYRPAWFIVGSQQGVRTASTLASGPDSMLTFVGRTPDVLIYQRTTP
ncbi:MAG: glycosyltransferase family 39 protein [Gemmatimonadaceae bacterium]|nr:glycosyltransferase family 39 protein [Gemmatimonadaceae bacterium]